MSVEFRKINGIDTIHDRFSADVLVQSSWREPRLDGRRHDQQQVRGATAAATHCPRLLIVGIDLKELGQ